MRESPRGVAAMRSAVQRAARLCRSTFRRLHDSYYDYRLRSVLTQISRVPRSDLRAVPYVESLIRRVGLTYDSRDIYGRDRRYMNLGRGMWQIPRQLAEFLVYVADHKVSRFLEVGTYTGYTFAFAAHYLARFTHRLEALSIDPHQGATFKTCSHANLAASYMESTSEALAGRKFDLCFVDADHSYSAVARDYANVGQHATICAFHDVNDDCVRLHPGNDGGVPRFWKELRDAHADTTREFLYHSEGRRVMGIGLIEHRQSSL